MLGCEKSGELLAAARRFWVKGLAGFYVFMLDCVLNERFRFERGVSKMLTAFRLTSSLSYSTRTAFLGPFCPRLLIIFGSRHTVSRSSSSSFHARNTPSRLRAPSVLYLCINYANQAGLG